jgi:hypothetical protein
MYESQLTVYNISASESASQSPQVKAHMAHDSGRRKILARHKSIHVTVSYCAYILIQEKNVSKVRRN